jgi:hypothetical protein
MVDKIAINRGWLEQANALPPICLKTGLATHGNIQKRIVSTAPLWAAVFIVFGGLGYIIARSAFGETVTLHIPRAKGVKEPHSISVGILSLYLLAISFLVLGAGTAGLLANVSGLVTLVVATALAVMNSQTKAVGVRMKHADPTVVLNRVHPAAAQVLVNAGIAARA